VIQSYFTSCLRTLVTAKLTPTHLTTAKYILTYGDRRAKFNTARHSLGLIRSVIVTCRYNVPSTYLAQQSSSSLLESVIENALATVVLGQPILGVGIVGEDTKEPAFVHIKTIDMRHMIEWKELAAASDRRRESKGQNEAEEAYNDRLLRSLEKYHEPLWEDLANKPGWKIVVHHDPHQLNLFRVRTPDGPSSATTAAVEGEGDKSLSLDISFCFHHAYADGKSAYIFHRDLQRALNNQTSTPSASPPSELQDHTLHLPTPPSIPPAAEKLISFTLSWGFILRMVWKEILYPSLRPLLLILPFAKPSESEKDALPWTGAPIDPSNPGTRIRMVNVSSSPSSLDAMLARCRSHKASLTGLIHALVARSLARRVFTHNNKHNEGNVRSFCSSTPISLAGYVDPSVAASSSFAPGESIHCLNTALTVHHDVDAISALLPRSDKDKDKNTDAGVEVEVGVEEDEAMWAFAAAMTSRLRARAAELPRDDISALSGLVGDWHAFFRAKFGKEREDTWQQSNLGSLSAVDAGFITDNNPTATSTIPAAAASTTAAVGQESENEEVVRKGRWVIDRAIFTQGALPLGAAINVNVAGVAGKGSVVATVTWQDGVVDEELMDELVRDLEMWFPEIGKTTV